MRKAALLTLLTLIIPAAFISLLVSGYFAHYGLTSQSLNRLDQYTALYNPVICGEISYLHDQLAMYLTDTIKTGTLSEQAGLEGNQDNRANEDINNFNPPALKNSSRFAEIAYFYLADDDINIVLCGFRSGK
ncbi:hypothetical protein ACOBQJ_14925 [Pelotomaculum propionicicum]|uniref:hypothetical protein n=1 Tax=Pelotomaculum propionicicum TaxID=258475 RepID=UPI003B771DF0